MRTEVTEIIYEVFAWGIRPSTKAKGWLCMGQRNTLEDARVRRDDLRRRFKRVRIIEYKSMATVVV